MSSSLQESTTRNRSNSGEDSGLPGHERKRPRLSETRENANGSPGTVSRSEGSAPAESEDGQGLQPPKPPLPLRAIDEAKNISSPTSKVTINTRPLSSQSYNDGTVEIGDDNTDVTTNQKTQSTAVSAPRQASQTPPHLSTMAASFDSQEPIVIPSSPSKSPEIEIAEVEDYDQDSGTTRWTTRIGGGGNAPNRVQPFHIYRTFPLAAEKKPGEARHAVIRISKMFVEGRKDDGEIFQRVKDWLSYFVASCDRLTDAIIEEDRDFWCRLPTLIENLLKREQKAPGLARTQDLIDFFVAYGQLTKLVLEYDSDFLQSISKLPAAHINPNFTIISWNYLMPLAWIFLLRAPFYEALRHYHNFDVMTIINKVADRLIEPSDVGCMNAIRTLVSALGMLLPKKPDLYKILPVVVNALSALMPLITSGSDELSASAATSFTQTENTRCGIEDIALQIDAILQEAISKQYSWLTIETGSDLLNKLNTVMTTLAVEVPRVGQKIITASGVAFKDADFTDLPQTMLFAWKFMILHKFMKHGRMELRVCGIETMAGDLVNIYFSHIQSKINGRHDPLVKYLVRFIQENAMIAYIIGVDSHPQLIQRSSNIVGFLCVAGTYEESDTDMLWRVVIESQDPRTVLEVLYVLQQCFGTFHLQDLHHICRKLIELPISRFNDRMLEFTTALLTNVREKTQSLILLTREPYDPVTRSLCLRLVCDTSHPEVCATDQVVRIRCNILQIMPEFFRPHRYVQDALAVSVDEEDKILSGLHKDIESHSDAASGAFFVVHAFLTMKELSTSAISRVVERCDLPQSLVEDFFTLRQDVEKSSWSTSTVAVQYESRLQCLQQLILHVPERFDTLTLQKIWSNLLVADDISSTIRIAAWKNLTSVLSDCSARNSVIDRILETLLPHLGPKDFTRVVLDFVIQSVVYESTFAKPHVFESDDVIELPGIERVWRMMLEAGPGTVEIEATDFIIDQYLRSPAIVKRPRAAVQNTHLALIDRVIELVLGSAESLKSFASVLSDAGNDDSMAIIASDAEIRVEELRFDRSLFFLRRFTECVRGRASLSPSSPRHLDALPEFPNKKGDNKPLAIQVHGNKFINNAVKKVTVGKSNTCAELYLYLADVSGFSQFDVIFGGQRIYLQDESMTLEQKIDSGLIIVHKTSKTQEQMPTNSRRCNTPIDEKILLHFHDLYNLLDCDDRMAREVFNFLSISSIREEVSSTTRSMSVPSAELLPFEKPYKLLFCVQALRSCIEFESFSSEPNADFLLYAVHAITSTLPRFNVANNLDTLSMSISYEMIDALLLAFKAKVSDQTSLAYLTDHSTFVQWSLGILAASQQTNINLSPEVFVKAAFAVLTEACLHDERLWEQLDENTTFLQVIQSLQLQEPRSDIRQVVLDVVLGLTGSSGKITLKVNDPRSPRSRYSLAAIDGYLKHFWKIVVSSLPLALQQETQCQEFFDTTLIVFRKIGSSMNVNDLNSLFKYLSSALLGHKHEEIVGQPLRDRVIAGVTKLLFECSKLLQNKDALPPSYAIVRELLSKFLFPPLSDSGMVVEYAHTPILDCVVRESLYDLVLILCQSDNDLDALVSALNNDLVPEDQFEPHLNNDRQCLRTEVGYAGLRNLSNTCYLNSLFSQLFMNLQFRELLFEASVIDVSRQRLLMELSKVFAYMQNSYEKSIDPSAAVESITTYDGDQIDVTVQMDVDEFFNLLFDRLEAQIVDPSSRNIFKSLYGGQTMHQIKSKECQHISERPEPFSALQIEIKGKTRLEDSLKAYVEGEILQGENKYSCTSCGRHVDAVKRACLKDVPNNLIFNLKRFDYDIMTGMRCKLNDRFQFPDTIDITPYTLMQLSNPDKKLPPDLFELTGVIVHSGTADSGHYYSFIRQRPSERETQYSWVQFNDHDVTPFDASLIQDNCFGGIDPTCYNIAKFYNAYMLFYQRKSDIQTTERQYTQHDLANPVRLALPADLEMHISQQNELFLHSYCAQDPSHARFIFQILEKVYKSNKNSCSAEHGLESRALRLTFDYLQQISSRWKALPDVEDTAKYVNGFSQRCITCAKAVLNWFTAEGILTDAVVRSPYQVTRKTFSNMLRISLQSINSAIEEAEGDEVDLLLKRYRRYLKACLDALAKAWDPICRSGRCWSEYFGLLNDILHVGELEATLVLDAGFLERCVDIIMLHINDSSEFRIDRKLRPRYAQYLNARDKNRPFNHGALITFFANMLTLLDLHSVPQGDARAQSNQKYKIGLTHADRGVLGLERIPYNFEWLKRIIGGRTAPQIGERVVMEQAQDRNLAGVIGATLNKGLEARSMPVAVSFLQPTLVYCEHCCSEHQIIDLVQPALEGINTIGLEYGREYLLFVQALLKVRNTTIDLEPGFLKDVVQQQIAYWAPVCLISPNELQHDVRGDAVDLVRELLLDPLEEARNGNPRMFRAFQELAHELANSAARYVNITFLNPKEETIVQPGQALQLIQVVDQCLDSLNIDNPVQENNVAEIRSIMRALGHKAEQAVETASAAEWQESSEMEAVSDPDMDEAASP